MPRFSTFYAELTFSLAVRPQARDLVRIITLKDEENGSSGSGAGSASGSNSSEEKKQTKPAKGGKAKTGKAKL